MVYRIEYNKVDCKTMHHMYLKADETITDLPDTALTFGTYEDCESYRQEHDYANSFHVQEMPN